MARFLGVEIPNNKKLEYGLRYVYGIGPHRAKIVAEESGIDPNTRIRDLSEEQLNQLATLITDRSAKVLKILGLSKVIFDVGSQVILNVFRLSNPIVDFATNEDSLCVDSAQAQMPVLARVPLKPSALFARAKPDSIYTTLTNERRKRKPDS